MTDTPETPAEKPPASLKSQASELGSTVFVALALAMVVRLLLFQPFTIPSA